MGELEEEVHAGGLHTTVWRIERPTRMVTFTMVTKFHEEKLMVGEGREIIAFGSRDGYLSSGRIGAVARDVRDSLEFFSDLLGTEPAGDSLFVTLIPAMHGQAFDGFLHIGDLATVRSRTGIVERFVAHEVAHQWFGHLVGWNSYRDQWLSESIAEYLAMLYVESGSERGSALFAEMIRAYTDELNGSIKSMFSPFSRPGLPLLNRAGAKRVGPIGHGYRAATSDTPLAYLSLAYRKGALVLHMLRLLLRDMSGSDDVFFAALRDFVSSQRGGLARTEDFVAAVSRHLPDEWDWYFNQWILHSEIPIYDWSYRVSTVPSGAPRFLVRLEIEQSGVEEGFRMPVPVSVELEDGQIQRRRVLVDEPQESFEFGFETRPKNLIFNPGHAVLAIQDHR
jgi:hypothetical protein